MTEIPLPSDRYEAPAAPSKGLGFGKTLMIALIIIIIIGAGIVVVMFSGIGNGGLTDNHSERQIADYMSQDFEIHPTYYRGGFSVSSSEVQTSVVPDLLFDIYVRDTGSDSVIPSIHIAVYEASVSTVDAAPTWDDLLSYLVDEGTYPSPVYQFINLYNYAASYTWVIWIEASSKTDVWDVDVTLTLRYNWEL